MKLRETNPVSWNAGGFKNLNSIAHSSTEKVVSLEKQNKNLRSSSTLNHNIRKTETWEAEMWTEQKDKLVVCFNMLDIKTCHCFINHAYTK